MARSEMCIMGAIAGLALSAPLLAQGAKLPIAEGVWVKTDTKCETATTAHVYGGNRFGTFYFYGPKQSMGPANETEALLRSSKVAGGFVMVNEGPLEVAPRPNGQAVVRANSPSQGVQWSDAVRLCAPATLSRKMRDALTKAGLLKATPRA